MPRLVTPRLASPRLATAAHKALRGFLTDDAVMPSRMLGTWPPKLEANAAVAGKLPWVPDHAAFLGVLRDYGCQVEGAAESSAMPNTMNASLVFELWAFAVACRPEAFTAEEIAECAQIAARAFLDPNLCHHDQGKARPRPQAPGPRLGF